jgi:hypothetical protein
MTFYGQAMNGAVSLGPWPGSTQDSISPTLYGYANALASAAWDPAVLRAFGAARTLTLLQRTDLSRLAVDAIHGKAATGRDRCNRTGRCARRSGHSLSPRAPSSLPTVSLAPSSPCG